jgi:hypothetical protein
MLADINLIKPLREEPEHPSAVRRREDRRKEKKVLRRGESARPKNHGSGSDGKGQGLSRYA